MQRRTLALLTLPVLLTSCSFWSSGSSTTAQMSSSSTSEETMAVSSQQIVESFRGTVAKAVTAQNAFALLVQDGISYQLESLVDLTPYLGKEVLVSGTVETSTTTDMSILHVIDLSEVLSSSESSESSESSSVEESSSSSSVSSKAVSSVTTKSSAPTVVASSSSSSLSSAEASSLSATDNAALLAARTQKMAKPRPVESWSQQYCSSHIGFCFPARSDYWYRSFGTGVSSLWHVELSSEDLVNVGDGPLSVDLISGRLEADSMDGTVVEKGDLVIGYKAWTSNRHFEVTAPKALRASVEYIVQHIAPFDTPVQ